MQCQGVSGSAKRARILDAAVSQSVCVKVSFRVWAMYRFRSRRHSWVDR